MEQPRLLVIVAHPDDETWGGAPFGSVLAARWQHCRAAFEVTSTVSGFRPIPYLHGALRARCNCNDRLATPAGRHCH